MRLSTLLISGAAALCASVSASAPNATRDQSRQILLSEFKPPQVFENTNLVRNVNLEKGYPRETINVVVKNVDKEPQTYYYLAFDATVVDRVGGLEVRNKKSEIAEPYQIDFGSFSETDAVNFYRISIDPPLAPSADLTLSISYTVLSALTPLPSVIEQMDSQTVTYNTSAYAISAYKTHNQKTKLRFPSTNIPDYTTLPSTSSDNPSDPTRQGASFTYGPYVDIPALTTAPISFRYEFTKPLLHAPSLQRDIEVSHWGGNVAFEEHYALHNRAAALKNHFSRVQWQMTQYSSPPTTALKELRIPLRAGSSDPYYTDDIGNVTTSRWRPKTGLLEMKPRYPVFGGWKYTFKMGWNADARMYLKKAGAESYLLRVPFLEGPKMAEGVEYEKVSVRVILPEGAINIGLNTTVPIESSEISIHRTFMDTLGRPTVIIHATNVVDEWRDKGDLLITYDYPWTAGYRKPLTLAAAVFSLFAAVWVLGKVDTRIGKK
ncbi:oligosaccharyltransferase alpha subunit [Trichodelitschia bisporula]|uniref:Dolichyl-diphosphooligosaccharide--protein glycosyltransferase subunit 1 n=1 Tax=Trichodelitschia bisporula TaxID=703511 RepID=A0A6G1I2D9_9PEZI|nr:oligosaccharyltransferase alpha subunit [Trichodelitschia bisporula]